LLLTPLGLRNWLFLKGAKVAGLRHECSKRVTWMTSPASLFKPSPQLAWHGLPYFLNCAGFGREAMPLKGSGKIGTDAES
jgi:hypothetical protein